MDNECQTCKREAWNHDYKYRPGNIPSTGPAKFYSTTFGVSITRTGTLGGERNFFLTWQEAEALLQFLAQELTERAFR